DLASRNPDLVNEAFRQYAIDWGIPRVGRLFKELDVPLTVVLNAEFPGKHASVWKEFRATQPNATDRRPRHEQHQPRTAARARPRRAKNLRARDVGPDRGRNWRPARRLVVTERLFQWRYDAGGGRRGHHLHDRPDGFRHHFALEDAGRLVDPAALSGGHGRH